MRRLCSMVAVIVTAALFIPITADAATVVKLDMPNLVASSDAIVIAEVVAQESTLEDDGRVYTTIQFRTEEVFKGDAGPEFTIRQVGGRDGEIATRAPGMPEFEADEKVFLFLTNFDAHPVTTGLAQGKFRIAVGPDDQTRYVVPQLHGLHLVAPEDASAKDLPSTATDATALQSPVPDLSSHAEVFRQVHELSAFRQQVQEAVEHQKESSE